MIRHCRYHCAVCDAHFTSLAGFDAHHRVVAGVNAKGAKTRYTVCKSAPTNTKKTSWIHEFGSCELTKGQIGQSVPCMIWRDSAINTQFPGSDSKGLNNPANSIPPTRPKDRSTASRHGSTETPATSGHPPCRVCGKLIEPTGLRGRPRLTHRECVE